VLLTWRLARRFASPGAALLASALVATSLLHVLFAQQARPHGIHATFAVFAVLAALRLRERPGWANYTLAGLACGLAFASLQSGLATLLPLGAAHLLRKREGSPPSRWRILLPIAIVAALAFAFYPTQGLTRPGHDGMRFSIDAQGISNRNHRILFADLDGYGFVLVVRYLFDHDPGLLLVATLGLIALLPALVRRWRNPELAIVLAYVLPYLGALGLFHRTYDRFLVPLLPDLAVLGAAGTIGFAGRLARSWSAGARRGLATAVFLAAIAFPTFASWKYASVRDAPDTVELAAAWIREHVRPEAIAFVQAEIVIDQGFDIEVEQYRI
jgi:4-amino-4-deoxy-L-arabinose transferase-like glycosyltransferase